MSIINEQAIIAARNGGPVILLESQLRGHPDSQSNFLAAFPEYEIMAFGDSILFKNHIDKVEQWFDMNPWDALEWFRQKVPGWHFGYLGYDLKNFNENLYSKNPKIQDVPDLYFFKPGLLLREDIMTGEEEVLCDTFQVFESLQSIDEQVVMLKCQIGKLASNITYEDYERMVDEGKRHIYEGDCYEINLSHQLSGAFSGDSFGLYRKMKQFGPVPFGGYLYHDDFVVCCASPERFLLKSGKTLVSQPIKGTRPRGTTVKEDRDLIDELRNSDKEKAENLMIVDLVRNDLNKISQAGSVHVEKLFEIQSFKSVHQMVSVVKSIIGDGISAAEAVRACFPMGSMTGTPKISALQIIDELEQHRRGIYSGAVGYFTPDDDFDFNVVIRSAIITKGLLTYSIGGAITADSNSMAEWEETWVKSEALTEAIHGT